MQYAEMIPIALLTGSVGRGIAMPPWHYQPQNQYLDKDVTIAILNFKDSREHET